MENKNKGNAGAKVKEQAPKENEIPGKKNNKILALVLIIVAVLGAFVFLVMKLKDNFILVKKTDLEKTTEEIRNNPQNFGNLPTGNDFGSGVSNPTELQNQSAVSTGTAGPKGIDASDQEIVNEKIIQVEPPKKIVLDDYDFESAINDIQDKFSALDSGKYDSNDITDNNFGL